MKNTLIRGDVILVNKCRYGANVINPFQFIISRVTSLGKFSSLEHLHDIHISGFAKIQRGDVVVFRDPQWPDEYMVKRCVGLPGDSLLIDGDSIYLVNNHVKDSRVQCKIKRSSNLDSGRLVFVAAKNTIINASTSRFYDIEKLSGFYTPTAIPVESSALLHENNYWIVKQNFYFMSGDNRHNSVDSRFLGQIPESYIVGKVSRILNLREKDRILKSVE